MSSSSPTPELSLSRSSSPPSEYSRGSSSSGDEVSKGKGIYKGTTLGKRRRSPSWDLSQRFDEEEDGGYLDDVSRSWKEAQESCEFMLRWGAKGSPDKERAYIKFLEERETMAREMLAKVACVRLRWGGEVDKSTLKVMRSYVAENLDEFSEDDIEIANLSGAIRRQEERGAGGSGSRTSAGVGGGGGGANASAAANTNDGADANANAGNGAGAGQGADDETGNGDGAGAGQGADDETGERIRKKPRKSKVATIRLLSEELSEQIEGMNLSGYESVEDRFRCVWVHASAVEGKLTANDLAKALYGYFSRPLPQGVSEEQALARLIVGYKNVNMEELDRAFADVKTAYTYGPSSVKSEFMTINNMELEKERIQVSEKLLLECGMKRGSVGLLEGIFLTMAALRLAIDWKSIDETDGGRKWKKARYDELFQVQCRAQLADLPVLTRRRQEVAMRRKWGKDNEKVVTRRNKVLALFKRDFNVLHGCVLDNVLTRARRADDEVEGVGRVPWDTGNDVENRKMLVELVRYFTTDEIAKFVDDTVDKLEQDAAEVVA
ncbi:hypothetical protein EYR36_010689 [Pleurotus pulmonarius]|nr:hypothetical protein EYR36_010689 [Pleurotus pulmonarius]KAF4590593.1 hypothetical protein EYR38_009895 [Pleurotus pulmonarius]